MKLMICTRCGSNELRQFNGYLVCNYCRSQYSIQQEDLPQKESIVDMVSDVEALLAKCRSDPANRRRYANLVLDIDPTNSEVLQYLR